jgi:hypothetical protein
VCNKIKHLLEYYFFNKFLWQIVIVGST